MVSEILTWSKRTVSFNRLRFFSQLLTKLVAPEPVLWSLIYCVTSPSEKHLLTHHFSHSDTVSAAHLSAWNPRMHHPSETLASWFWTPSSRFLEALSWSAKAPSVPGSTQLNLGTRFPLPQTVALHQESLVLSVICFHSFVGKTSQAPKQGQGLTPFLPASIFTFQTGLFFISEMPSHVHFP